MCQMQVETDMPQSDQHPLLQYVGCELSMHSQYVGIDPLWYSSQPWAYRKFDRTANVA